MNLFLNGGGEAKSLNVTPLVGQKIIEIHEYIGAINDLGSSV